MLIKAVVTRPVVKGAQQLTQHTREVDRPQQPRPTPATLMPPVSPAETPKGEAAAVVAAERGDKAVVMEVVGAVVLGGGGGGWGWG